MGAGGISPPQSVRPVRKLPELDGAVFAARGVQLAIGTEACRPHRSMVSSTSLQLALALKIPDVYPSIARATRDEPLSFAVESHTGDLAVGFDMFQQVSWSATIEEIDVLACCDTDNTFMIAIEAGVELA